MVKLFPELKMYNGSNDLDLDLGTSIALKSFELYTAGCNLFYFKHKH